MFDFTKSFSSKSNLIRGLKAANIDVVTCMLTEAAGRWTATLIQVPVADSFEATEAELAAQQVRPGHEWEDTLPVVEVTTVPVASMADEFAKVENAAAPVAPVAKPVAAPKAKGTKVVLEVRNEVTRPKDGGVCAKAWAIFDRLGAAVQNKDAVFEGAKEGINEFTIRTQIYRWRTFNGIALQGRKKAK